MPQVKQDLKISIEKPDKNKLDQMKVASWPGMDEGTVDLVTFPKGLSCTWHVKQPVRKHYRFG